MWKKWTWTWYATPETTLNIVTSQGSLWSIFLGASNADFLE